MTAATTAGGARTASPFGARTDKAATALKAENRKLPGYPALVTLRAFHLGVFAKDQLFKLMVASLADVFENRHPYLLFICKKRF